MHTDTGAAAQTPSTAIHKQRGKKEARKENAEINGEHKKVNSKQEGCLEIKGIS